MAYLLSSCSHEALLMTYLQLRQSQKALTMAYLQSHYNFIATKGFGVGHGVDIVAL
jgi:hypothetical protein